MKTRQKNTFVIKKTYVNNIDLTTWQLHQAFDLEGSSSGHGTYC